MFPTGLRKDLADHGVLVGGAEMASVPVSAKKGGIGAS